MKLMKSSIAMTELSYFLAKSLTTLIKINSIAFFRTFIPLFIAMDDENSLQIKASKETNKLEMDLTANDPLGSDSIEEHLTEPVNEQLSSSVLMEKDGNKFPTITIHGTCIKQIIY